MSESSKWEIILYKIALTLKKNYKQGHLGGSVG